MKRFRSFSLIVVAAGLAACESSADPGSVSIDRGPSEAGGATGCTPGAPGCRPADPLESRSEPADSGTTAPPGAGCDGGTGGGGPPVPPGPHANGLKDGDETDVDCGGPTAPGCETGQICVVAGDCKARVCTADVCIAPTHADGVANGDETDVDCGGSAPKCALGQGCLKHADCTSDACSYESRCVAFNSCTQHRGGDTCGAGETGAVGASHESCCATVSIADRPAAQGGPFTLDRYHLTAGRMRAFLERYGGNLKAWAATIPPGWNPLWTATLPGDWSEASYLLGPYGKRGCRYNGEGGHTFWTPPVDEGDGSFDYSDWSQDVLDEKALNCVPWHVAMALCVFDGGRLATQAEIAWSFENAGRAAGKTEFPWGWKDGSAYDPWEPDPRLSHEYNYATPNPPVNLRLVAGQYPLDHTFYIAPPGRFPSGVNMYGAEDMAGNLLTWVADGEKRFAWTMSWEEHPKDIVSDSEWNPPDGVNGYYAIGARCAR